jgi:sortase A
MDTCLNSHTSIYLINSWLSCFISQRAIENAYLNKKVDEELQNYDKTNKGKDKSAKAEKSKEYFAIPKDKDKVAAKIEIPSAKIKEPIYPGDATKSQLEKGLAFVEKDENMRDQNVSIAGHNYTDNRNKGFNHLHKIKKGDKIYISFKGEKSTYKLTQSKEVKPDESEVLEDDKSSKKDVITLITCEDYDAKSDKWLTRSVYTAEKVS